MALVPSRDLEALQFFENHYPTWLTNATAIGLTAAAVNSFKSNVIATRTKYVTAQTKRQEAKTATQAYQGSLGDIRDQGAALIQLIRGFAEQTNNPGVWDLADLPRPAARERGPAPGKPKNIVATVEPTGALTLRWTCDNTEGDRRATGVFYMVMRRFQGEANFTPLGGTGTRSYTDETLPFGTDSVTYLIQGVRGDQTGEPSDQFTVQFGVGSGGGGGGFTTTQQASEPVVFKKVA